MTKKSIQVGDIVQLVPMGSDDDVDNDMLPLWHWGKIGEVATKATISVDGDLLLHIKTGSRKQVAICYLDEVWPLGASTR